MSRLDTLIHLLKEQIDSSAEDSFLTKTKEEKKEKCEFEASKHRLRLLDAAFSPKVRLHRLDVKQLLATNGLRGWRSRVGPTDPERLHEKERQKELGERNQRCAQTTKHKSKKKGLEKPNLDERPKEKSEQAAADNTDGTGTDSSDMECSDDGSWWGHSSDSEDDTEVIDGNRELKSTTTSSKHTGKKKKNFVCIVCGKKFRNKSNLRTHKTIHKGEKLFGCDICGKSFTRKHSQDAHMRIHEEEKPFGCSVPNKGLNCKKSS